LTVHSLYLGAIASYEAFKRFLRFFGRREVGDGTAKSSNDELVDESPIVSVYGYSGKCRRLGGFTLTSAQYL